jgi:phosphoribosyl-ATP pyrophosphohydrolase
MATDQRHRPGTQQRWQIQQGLMMAADILHKLEQTIAARRGASPDTSYVAKLSARGLDAMLKKIGEEATETVIAAKSGERDAIIYESADLIFHLLVMLGHQNIGLDDVLAELARREGVSGIDEKNARGTP